ncbi:hypothetical protein TIN4_93 [Tsukamurella phage TIN4]|uniref:Uncharacterized protein n=2 Tax=Tinduovirus TIN3 TaxID=1982571 RepID=A0A0K0N654_9CAUD|nr:hypothetical protein AVT54_gp032 [Tsukamurella phage TIN3]YP_009604223.1 hypothetical protein FDH87_gp032 [Tsukamurella phage TIN4]AKJ71890.1 hypothetical protein TIN3_93 [Tsukamurella phage TIN3]AKJ71999.1 hypothetical protein TIN4_93 [Tsukamurella phage TIN4]
MSVDTLNGSIDAGARGTWYAIRDTLTADQRANVEEVARERMIELGYGPDEIADEGDLDRIECLMRCVVATANFPIV